METIYYIILAVFVLYVLSVSYLPRITSLRMRRANASVCDRSPASTLQRQTNNAADGVSRCKLFSPYSMTSTS